MHTVQLVIQFPASSAADFDALVALEDRLIEALDERHLVDGHDFGSGTANIFIHTNAAPEAFAITRSVMTTMGYTEWGAAQRSLLDDEDYHRIWPVDSEEPFTPV